jgi:gamma-butyrobetaine dioxygenase
MASTASDLADKTGGEIEGDVRIAAVARSDDHLTIAWRDHVQGRAESRFHYFWLRDNCHCAACLHPTTWERTIDSFALDPAIAPQGAGVEDGGETLRLTWPDGHVTRLDAGWLAARDYDGAMPRTLKRPIKTWDADILRADMPEHAWQAVMDGDDAVHSMLVDLRERGLAIVRNVPAQEGEVERVARRIAFLRETNFGVGFQVENKPDPNNVAYTALELKAHTDLPNREMPPGIQFLHCHRADAPGGESLLVDGFHAAKRLREEAADAFDILTRIALPFRFVDADWDIRWRAPTIQLDDAGDLQEVRYHDALTAALDAPFDEMPALYDALRRFTDILRRPAMELRLKLAPGDMIAFHNRRILHGRAAFDPNAGLRKLEGCYVDCDDAWARLRVLERG